jgi:hypothetical protein
VQFEDAKLHPVMLDNIQLAKYSVPTPVQVFPFPISSENRNMLYLLLLPAQICLLVRKRVPSHSSHG